MDRQDQFVRYASPDTGGANMAPAVFEPTDLRRRLFMEGAGDSAYSSPGFTSPFTPAPQRQPPMQSPGYMGNLSSPMTSPGYLGNLSSPVPMRDLPSSPRDMDVATGSNVLYSQHVGSYMPTVQNQMPMRAQYINEQGTSIVGSPPSRSGVISPSGFAVAPPLPMSPMTPVSRSNSSPMSASVPPPMPMASTMPMTPPRAVMSMPQAPMAPVASRTRYFSDAELASSPMAVRPDVMATRAPIQSTRSDYI